MSLSQGDAAHYADVLRAMAHPMRLQILCRLGQGELSVAGFEAELGLKQPSLSQQLAALREAGLVTARKEARSVVYELANAVVLDVLQALCDPLPRRPSPASADGVNAPVTSDYAVFAVAGWGIA